MWGVGVDMIKVIDLETTGLEANSQIAQLAILNLDDNLDYTGYKEYYFNIHGEMPNSAYKVNMLSQEFLEKQSGGRYFEDMKNEVLEDLRNNVLVAHNASFEKKILTHQYGDSLKCRWICTMLRYTPTVAINSASKNGEYKHINLSELLIASLEENGETLENINRRFEDLTGRECRQHDALGDVFYTAYALKTFG